MIKLGVGAWITGKEQGLSYLFPLEPENHGKTEIAGTRASVLIQCDHESVGGGVDPGELPEEALRREFREERKLSLRPAQLQRLPDGMYVEQFRDGAWVDFVVVLYLLKLDDSQIELLIKSQGMFAVPDLLLDTVLKQDGKSYGRKFLRPFTVEFGNLMIRNNFYRS